MGVKGLWELLNPVARPIKLETLSNKQLAIDASIWLHQFLKGMRDKEGQAVGNAHIIGFFRRICKLLYYNIKPIFVFDGGTPALKRLTILERRKRRRHDENLVKRTAEKLLAAQLRLRALEQRKAAKKKKELEKQEKQNNVVHDTADNPKYLDTLTGEDSRDTTDMEADIVKSAALSSLAKRIKDRYILPPMETDFETLAKIRSSDERFGYDADEDDVNSFLEDFKKDAGLANIDSDVFKALPSEMQYEILHDIRLRSRVTSYERVQEMVRLAETPMDFSKLQVEGVIRRNKVTHKLLTVNQAVNKTEATSKPGRIASQRNRQYILVKNEEGGWVLGGKKPMMGTSVDKPVQLDSDVEENVESMVKDEDEDKDAWESDDDDDVEFEEVKIPSIPATPTLNSTERSETFTNTATLLHPAATPPIVKADDENSLINHLEAYMDEDESIEKVMAKFAEIEDEMARKQAEGIQDAVSVVTDGDRMNERNGLQLARPGSTPEVVRLDEAARQHLARVGFKAGDDSQWPEVLSDGDELDSFETINSDNTIDSTDLEDMIEDEQTGEVLTRKAYYRKYQINTGKPLQQTNGRALSQKEESQLDTDEFHQYWTGYTPESFKVKNTDHEIMIREAIFEWDEERLSNEKHSATRKLEKSSVNDTVGVESLQFWLALLESVCDRRIYVARAQLEQTSKIRSDVDHTTDDMPIVHTILSSTRKSRLLQSILTDDEDAEADVDHHGQDHDPSLSGAPLAAPDRVTHIKVPATISKAPETTISLQSSTTPQKGEPIEVFLDFGSSILKRRPSLPVTEQLDAIGTSESITESVTETLAESVLSAPESTEGVDMDTELDAFAGDSGVGSLTSTPSLEAATITSSSMLDMERVMDMDRPLTPVLKEVAVIVAGEYAHQDLAEINVVAADEDEKHEEDEEDEAHDADLENEEQYFTNLFPDMASLPGALLMPEKSSPATPPAALMRTDEEQTAHDLQDATKMFEESKALESEIKDLRDQHRKHQRDADDLTDSMVAETKMLLRLFGIPYIVAPMEAEAQCADLQLRGVVDGILTEDSDVFLFGGMRIFKNVFKEEKYVECYLMSDIERDLGVGRDRLVSLAYLLGSDYTTGIKGVGLITAMEILRIFPKLEQFAKWWKGEQHKQEDIEGGSGADNGTDAKDDTVELGLDSIDDADLEKLAKQCKKIHLPSSFPDPHIADAYIRPLVDDDPTDFQWGIPDLDGLRDFLRKSLGWDQGEVDRVLLPIIRQMTQAPQQTTQMTLDNFFDMSVGTNAYQPPLRKNLHKSARLRKVVGGLTGQNTASTATSSPTDRNTKVDEMRTKKATSKKTPAKRKPTGTKKNADGVDKDNDGKPQGEDVEEGFLDELETKKQRTARSGPTRRAKSAQTKVPEAVTAAKRQLQSKDVRVKLSARRAAATAAAAAAAAATEAEDAGLNGKADYENGDQPTSKEATPAAVKIKNLKRTNDEESDGTSTSGGSSGCEDQEYFTPSHWDILAEKQRLQQQSAKKRGRTPSSSTLATAGASASGIASSLSAIVSASNAARYGTTSFRNKDTGTRTSPSKKTSSKKARTLH
ncbi:DNA repair protein rad2 [Mortierella polycephala]|uniref:DNA repair protein rad2 n=1 Tax=Mortierella polycephala TaxID=41804 RepID=A0A9P6U3H6_9FUNG|nr:DNA repair protein rad2 [Mortierella polycephala]